MVGMERETATAHRHPVRGPRRVRVLRRARRRARFREAISGLGPKSRQVRLADGRTLGFDEFGDPEGSPVLFFHGFCSSRVVRHPDDEIATQLGARVIAVDRPGIGISTRHPNRRVTDWPRDVVELLDRLGIERCSIVAWSGGGPYALACGWQIPERLQVIGLISAPAPLSGVPGSTGYTWRRHRAMSRTADHAPWVIALAMWRWSRQQRSDPAKQLDEAIAGMIEADRRDPRRPGPACGHDRQRGGDVPPGQRRHLRRGALPGTTLGLPHRGRRRARAHLARRARPGRARRHGQATSSASCRAPSRPSTARRATTSSTTAGARSSASSWPRRAAATSARAPVAPTLSRAGGPSPRCLPARGRPRILEAGRPPRASRPRSPSPSGP